HAPRSAERGLSALSRHAPDGGSLAPPGVGGHADRRRSCAAPERAPPARPPTPAVPPPRPPMRRRAARRTLLLPWIAILLLPVAALGQADPRLPGLKSEALQRVEARAKLVQEIVDVLYSFGELGMQEFETQRYLTGLLEEEGFEIELGVAGMPSAWTARWSNGSGRPVIALGSDVDGIPQSSQRPGVAYHDPTLPLAPGHGEGHNSGQAVNVAAALAVKELMERENLDGTLLLWPGIAEEQLAGKAYFVRDGVFDGVDVNLFTHVASGFGVSWGQSAGNAMVSAQFRF